MTFTGPHKKTTKFFFCLKSSYICQGWEVKVHGVQIVFIKYGANTTNDANRVYIAQNINTMSDTADMNTTT